jgi:NAD(P)-dependent dehydrogenase (short-subunit alcohol dehydrogenase family)
VNAKGAEDVCAELNKTTPNIAQSAQVDVTDWNAQAKVFSQAVHAFGRIDYVYSIAGIGERRWLPHDPNASGFEMPDLSTLDVDLRGLLFTVALAVQQFRKQEPNKDGFRGKSAYYSSMT